MSMHDQLLIGGVLRASLAERQLYNASTRYPLIRCLLPSHSTTHMFQDIQEPLTNSVLGQFGGNPYGADSNQNVNNSSNANADAGISNYLFICHAKYNNSAPYSFA
jgi:hypothetical protein